MKLHLIILSALLLESSTAQSPPACAAGVTCPPGGMWGEWTTVGDGKCESSCGGCDQLFQTRDCMSSQLTGCPCSTGNSSRYIPCNMKTCPYPAQRACCTPYVPMVISGTQVCGPTPRTVREPGASCCPVGGLWSDYSGYQSQNGQWVRTRRCLSATIGCPCTGNPSESTSTCPCSEPASAVGQCTNIPNADASYKRGLVIDHATCTAKLEMVGHNDGPTYCSSLRSGMYIEYARVSLLVLNQVDGGCTTDHVFECTEGVKANRWQDASFTCDTTSKNWIYDYTGKQITSYAQAVYKTLIP
ncbi:hypothetical protein L5515_010881 [Caenorhabditis briggsae]|uniref:Uncharacterized protein n=1 Tax=Caenorhabditis briggsae TaxID=6238 RepID=A0AAE9JEQ0_CAEBR|nr:hypothetical protein L5515_010881 [Caenorhabditis briggsae]